MTSSSDADVEMADAPVLAPLQTNALRSRDAMLAWFRRESRSLRILAWTRKDQDKLYKHPQLQPDDRGVLHMAIAMAKSILGEWQRIVATAVPSTPLVGLIASYALARSEEEEEWEQTKASRQRASQRDEAIADFAHPTRFVYRTSQLDLHWDGAHTFQGILLPPGLFFTNLVRDSFAAAGHCDRNDRHMALLVSADTVVSIMTQAVGALTRQIAFCEDADGAQAHGEFRTLVRNRVEAHATVVACQRAGVPFIFTSTPAHSAACSDCHS